MARFEKTFDGKKFNYFFNGVLYRKSSTEFKYGCFAVRNEGGKEFPAALGNDENSTLKSNWKRYCEYCKLIVVKIEIM